MPRYWEEYSWPWVHTGSTSSESANRGSRGPSCTTPFYIRDLGIRGCRQGGWSPVANPPRIPGVTVYYIWSRSLVGNILCSLNKNVFLLFSFICMYFTLMNDWFRGLCHTPEIFVRLLKKKKAVCLVTYFSKIISLPGNQSSLNILVLAHYVHKKCKQMWRRTRKKCSW